MTYNPTPVLPTSGPRSYTGPTVRVTYSCGHYEDRPRPAGIADPLNCLCFSCSPSPEKRFDFRCYECSKAS